MDRKSLPLKPHRLWPQRRRQQPFAPPGTLVADPNAPKPILSYLAYGPTEFREEKGTTLDKIDDVASITEELR